MLKSYLMKEETGNWLLQAKEHFEDAEYMYSGHIFKDISTTLENQ